jgi:multiple sugar transport system ATP-binding protein
VYVTHDQSEAMTLGDRVAVLGDGKLQQCDTPRELYARPSNTFVAGFIGSPAMNLCTVPCTNGTVELGGVSVPMPRSGHGPEVVVGLRPESLELASDGIAAEVEVVEEIGADSYVFAAADVGRLVARCETRHAPDRGARINLRPKPDQAHLFDPATGDRLK